MALVIAVLALGFVWGLLVLLRVMTRWLCALAERRQQGGDPRYALRLAVLLKLIPPASNKLIAHVLEAGAYRDSGRTAQAIVSTRAFLQNLRLDWCPWALVNVAVDIFVNSGSYTEALDVPKRWSKQARTLGRRKDPQSYALTTINQAEALYNLGRNELALRKLDSVGAALDDSSPLALNGLLCLRAWILAQTGQSDKARATLESANTSALSPRYDSEVEYTWAAIERESGDLDKALQHAECGLAHARRASSVRNGLFMIAHIASLRGDLSRARELFQRASDHPYQAQAGEGMMHFAAFLEIVGELDNARTVRQLAAERDPESAFLHIARHAHGAPLPTTPADYFGNEPRLHD